MVGNEMHLHPMLSGKPFSALSNSSFPIRWGRHRYLKKGGSLADKLGLTVAPHAQGKAGHSEGQKRSMHIVMVCDVANVRNGSKTDISENAFLHEHLMFQYGS